MNIIVYSIATGQILRSVSCTPEDAWLQAGENEAILEGTYPDTEFYVDFGVVQPIPEKPSKHHVFDYETKQWIDPRTPATEWPIVRTQRDRLLQQSDWTQLPDVPLATKEAWAAYRQSLRDVTLQPDPFNIVWPTPPQ